MKKIITVFLIFLMVTSSAFAAPLGMQSVPTDIKVMFHGKEIPAVCVNNAMYISADDFSEYGYAVTYIDSVRALFVNKVSQPTEIVPSPIGKVSKTLDTDIRVFLNGTEVNKNSTFAWNGKMYVNANVIARYRDGKNQSDSGNPGYPHFLTNSWDGEKRILYVDDAQLPSKEEQKALWLSYGGNREEYTFLSFTETEYKGEGFEIVCLRVGGLPRGSERYWYYFGDDGKVFSVNEICNAFSIHKYGGGSTIENVRVEGRKMYFDGSRIHVTPQIKAEPWMKTFKGSYCLDLDTTVVTTISEEEV